MVLVIFRLYTCRFIVIYFIRRALYKNMWEYQNLNLLKRLNTFIFAHFYNDYLIWKHVYLFRYEMPIMRSVDLKVLFLFHLITRAFKLTKKAWIHHYSIILAWGALVIIYVWSSVWWSLVFISMHDKTWSLLKIYTTYLMIPSPFIYLTIKIHVWTFVSIVI